LDREFPYIYFGIFYVAFPMDVHYQTLKDILHMIEEFKSQMHDTLHNFQKGLRDGFCSIHESFVSIQEKYAFVKMKKCILGMLLRMIVMISVWIVVIYGMTTTFIFYLMTLLPLR
jgi:hypothetical protein